MTDSPEEKIGESEALQALARIRASATERLFPGTVSGIRDGALELVPRIVASEIAYRSRLLEELATLQHLLLVEALRPLKERAPASLPAIVAQLRGLISDQLKIVREAPIGTGADAAKHQAADLLARRAYLMAEIRRRGLEKLLASGEAAETRPDAGAGQRVDLDEIAALAGALTATAPPGEGPTAASGDAHADADGGEAPGGPHQVDAGALARAHARTGAGAGRVS